MAEALVGLGVAASIIAVVQVTAQVLSHGWTVVKALKGTTKKALLDVLNELTVLHRVLLTLHSQVSTVNSVDLAVAALLKAPAGPLAACDLAVKDTAALVKDLTTSKVRTLVTRGVSIEKDLDSSRQSLERLKTVLLLALHALSNAIQTLLKDEFQRLEQSERLTQGRLDDICVDIEMLITESRLARSADQDRETIKALRWLTFIDHELNHGNAQRLRDDETGLWFLSSPHFKSWVDGPVDTLWLHAIPGAGKTILLYEFTTKIALGTCKARKLTLGSSSAVDFLIAGKKTQQVAVCYFYFDFRAQEKRETCGLLRSLIAQLSRATTTFPPEVNELYDRFKGRRSQPTAEELVDLLAVISHNNFSRVYVLIDAVDECNERDVLLPILERLAASRAVSLMISSRREKDISDMMSVLGPINVSFEADQVAGDVHIFLTKTMKVEPYLKTLSQDLQDTILKTLLDGANGMFRWVKCQLDLIKSLKRPKSIRNAMKTLPGSLDETYERILCSVDGDEERMIVRLLLQFVVFAARPMTMREIAEAVIIDHEATEMDAEARFTYSSDVFSGCESLFVLTGDYVGIAHYSIQEYLTSERILQGNASFFSIREKEAMGEICLRCLNYMNYDDFYVGPASSQEEFELRLEMFPFLDYACNNWFTHCKDPETQERISTMFDSIWVNRNHPKYLTWAQVFSDKTITLKRDFKSYTLLTPSMLYYPALWGHGVLCGRILHQNKTTINQEGGYYGTALQAAAMSKHGEVVKLLIDEGADINQRSGYFGNALQAAAVAGDHNIALRLLRKGALVDTEAGTYGTALQGASRHGHLEVVELLLRFGADVNQHGGPYGTALQAAANNGQLKIVQSLIESGACVNDNLGAFGTALEGACAAAIDHSPVVEILLQNGANPEISGGIYSLPLIAASLNGHTDSVTALLQHGARSDKADGVYGYPLQSAAMNGHQDIVDVLLKHGASPNARGGRYSTAIQAAARNGHIAVIRKLLEYDAEVDGSAGYYGSALQAAARNGFTEVARVLLDHNANANSEGGQYGNPLQAAASTGTIDIVQLLLGRGSNVNQTGGPYHTALSAAAAAGHVQMVQLLLQAGADPGIVGGKHGSALGGAVANGHLDVIKTLEEYAKISRTSSIETTGPLILEMKGQTAVGTSLSTFLRSL